MRDKATTTEKILATVKATFTNCLSTDAYSIEYKTRLNDGDEHIDLSKMTLDDVKSFKVSKKKDKNAGDYYYLKIVVEKTV